MQIGPAVSQAISIFRELHGNYRLAIFALTETTDRPFPRSRKLLIDRFLIYGKECILTLNSMIFPSYSLFLVIFGLK